MQVRKYHPVMICYYIVPRLLYSTSGYYITVWRNIMLFLLR